MKSSLWSFAFCLTLLAGASRAVSSAPPANEASAKYTFHEPPLNSLGVKGLADLRGKPVVIDFWGRN